MGLSRNKVAVSEGAAGSPPFYGERPVQSRHRAVWRILNERFCCSIFRDRCEKAVGFLNAEGPPVPIPNTEVKLCSAEDTSLATVRENRSKPTPRQAEQEMFGYLRKIGDPFQEMGV